MTVTIRAGSTVEILLRLAVTAKLTIDAAVHFLLAPGYQLSNPGGIGLGNLFYVEMVASIIAAVYLVVRGSRAAYLTALLVVGSALAAVLVSTYAELPAIGPIPAMYEPVWYLEKTISAVAEGVGVVLAMVCFFGVRRPGARTQRRRGRTDAGNAVWDTHEVKWTATEGRPRRGHGRPPKG